MLGPVQAVAGGRPLALGGPKQRALLAELLLHEGEPVGRDHLVDALWGEEPPGSATTSLQVYVHGLRRAVGAERIETRGSSYRIRFEPEELDLARFRRLVRRAERALADERPAEAAEDLDAALALWSGPALADIADQPIARTATPQLEELRLRAHELRADAQLALGAHAALVPALEGLIAEHPFRERLREQHVLALYRAGRQKEALDAYRTARRVLVDELGVEPGPALQELERAILRQDETLTAPEAPAAAPRRPLPTPPTPLVGRRLEIAAVDAMLRRDECRLVTLTGPGGTGKTRLALAAATALAGELRDGAVFVDLSAVTDEALVLPTVARSLELSETDDPLDYLRERSLLLVLDNLEQLGEGVAPVADLLAAAPRLRVLATSRTPLRLSAEHEYPVPPLPVPAAQQSFEELAANDAVRLFTARAQAANPAFALSSETVASVARICRRLDGLPLALELAAARTRSLGAPAIEERVTRALELLVEGARDLPPRQRTLRATLDWSYGLLAPEAQELLARVSVFAGGWTLADLDEVVGDEALAQSALVEASLVRRREERYVLLETVREYALERLRERGEEDELRRRHALHFIAVAEAARAGILAGGDASERGLAVLGDEQDNLRAALAWAVELGDVEREVALLNAQRWYWIVSGAVGEARRAFAHAVHATAECGGALHALALHGDATFAVKQGHVEEARPRFEEALRIYRELGDWEWIGRCSAELGSVAVAVGDLDRAVELYEECVRLFGERGDDQKRAIAVSNLGAIAAQREDFKAAVAYGREAIELQRRGDNRDDLAVTLSNLSRALLALGQTDEARETLGEALTLAVRLRYRLVLAHAFGAAAELAAQLGDHATAARLLGGSAAMFERMGMTIPPDEVHEQEQTYARIEGALGTEESAALVAAGHATPPDALTEEALATTR